MDSSDAAAASSAEAAQTSPTRPARPARGGGRDVVRAEITPTAALDLREEPGAAEPASGRPLSARAEAIARAASAGLDALSEPRAGGSASPTETPAPRDPFAAPTELDLRRKRKRRQLGVGQSLITILDGPRAGEEFDASLRDFALQQTIFLLKSELRVGQRIEIDGPNAPRDPLVASTDLRDAMKPVVAEVVRSRLLSNGRWEIVAERVKASAAPKISESQRRHERRRQRLAQQGVILNTTMRPIAPKDEPPAK